LAEIVGIAGKERGREVRVKVVGSEEYVRYYVGRGRDEAAVEWWSSTYAALERGECLIEHPTLDELLKSRGVEAKPVEQTKGNVGSLKRYREFEMLHHEPDCLKLTDEDHHCTTRYIPTNERCSGYPLQTISIESINSRVRAYLHMI
jgi:hypothetical protein